MPGPIAITRASPPNQGNAEASSSSAVPGASGSSLGLGSSLSRSGNHGRLGTTPSGALGASFTGPGSATYREAMARSFGKDANDIMDYSIARFSSSHASTDSDMTALPSTSYPRNKLETSFCSNFKCCGNALENLHDLLQHYEEAHVKFEDDEIPTMVEDDTASAASSSATSSQPPSPKVANSIGATSSADEADEHGEHLSAFDTTVMRSPIKGKKRSFGQFSNPAQGGASSGGGVHQSLRRALIDGGVGRSSRASSVYSAGSPFSTPSSSIPGTPTPADPDTDAAFFGNGAGTPAFSSLSIRGNEDHDLPSCAPPNLFFPAAGTSSAAAMGSNAATSSAAALQKNMAMPVAGLQGMAGVTAAPPAKREKTVPGFHGSANGLESSLANPSAFSDRPYKCTSPGCDKAYKQMNGLKYHRIHGQCNQNNMPPQQQLGATVNDRAIHGSAMNGSPGTAHAAADRPTSPSDNASSDGSPTDSSSSPSTSAPGSPRGAPGADVLAAAAAAKLEKVYICQVGNCGKRYKNLNGLRYHYLHSGSHGMLGLQLLHSNGGGASARADATTGRPAISTNDLSSDALKAVAQAAAEQQALNHRNAMLRQQQQQQQQQRDAASQFAGARQMPALAQQQPSRPTVQGSGAPTTAAAPPMPVAPATTNAMTPSTGAP